MKKSYHAHFERKLGDQDKPWVLHKVCSTFLLLYVKKSKQIFLMATDKTAGERCCIYKPDE